MNPRLEQRKAPTRTAGASRSGLHLHARHPCRSARCHPDGATPGNPAATPYSAATEGSATHSGRATRFFPRENQPVREGGLRVVVAANSFARQSRGLGDDGGHGPAEASAIVTAAGTQGRVNPRLEQRKAPTRTAGASRSGLHLHARHTCRSARCHPDGATPGGLPPHRTPQRLRDPPHTPGAPHGPPSHKNKPVREGGLRVVVAANSFARARWGLGDDSGPGQPRRRGS